jgi:hypothetical protein
LNILNDPKENTSISHQIINMNFESIYGYYACVATDDREINVRCTGPYHSSQECDDKVDQSTSAKHERAKVDVNLLPLQNFASVKIFPKSTSFLSFNNLFSTATLDATPFKRKLYGDYDQILLKGVIANSVESQLKKVVSDVKIFDASYDLF